MTDERQVTARLAEFVAASRWEDIPASVRHEGMRSLVNFVGCALGGARDEAVGLAARVLSPFFGAAQAESSVAASGWTCSTPRSSMRSAPMSSNTTIPICRR